MQLQLQWMRLHPQQRIGAVVSFLIAFSMIPKVTALAPCPAGKYLNTGACSPCGQGKYSSVPGANSSSTCKNCSIGKFTYLEGAADESKCFSCPPGRIGTQAGLSYMTQCIPCDSSKGMYSSEPGATDCTYCKPPFRVVGRVACAPPCPPGTQVWTSSCQTCKPGYFSSDGILCRKCDSGTYSDATGQSICKNCAPGRYGVTEGLKNATCSGPCAAGRYSGYRYPECDVCAEGKYQKQQGRSSCSDCPPAERSTGQRKHCICIQRFYRGVTSNDYVPNAKCLSCDRLAETLYYSRGVGANDFRNFLRNCDIVSSNMTYDLNISTLQLQDNYWRVSNVSLNILPCPKLGSCIYNASRSGVFPLSSEKVRTGDAICSPRFRGPVCGICKEGYVGKNCDKCWSAAWASWLASFTLGALVCTYIYIEVSSTSKGRSDLSILKKMLLSYWQTNAIIGEYPSHGTALLSDLMGWQRISNGAGTSLSPVQCSLNFDFYQQFYSFMLAPIALIFLTVGAQLSSAAIGSRCRSFRVPDMWNKLVVAVTIEEFLLYSSVCQAIFQVFDVYPHDIEIGSESGAKTTRYLQTDFSVDVGKHAYASVRYVAIAGLFLYVLGIPLLGAWVLFRGHSKIIDGNQEFFARFGFLYDGYRLDNPFTYQWEFVVTLRKLCITLIGVAISSAFMQEYVGSLLIIGAFCAQVVYKPFRTARLNHLEAVGLFAIFLSQMLSIIYAQTRTSEDNKTAEDVTTFLITAIHLFTTGLFLREIYREAKEDIKNVGGVVVSHSRQLAGTVRQKISTFQMRRMMAPGRKAGDNKETHAVDPTTTLCIPTYDTDLEYKALPGGDINTGDIAD